MKILDLNMEISSKANTLKGCPCNLPYIIVWLRLASDSDLKEGQAESVDIPTLRACSPTRDC